MEEEFVSPIIDESGSAFLLVFNHATCEFYYILVEPPPDDNLHSTDLPGTWRGEASGFAYIEDALGRRVLAGVRGHDVSMNTFFDGPFDQLPPRLNVRDLIRWAYPGIEERRGLTLDEHGGWVGMEGTRVAISPYAEYGEWDLNRHLLDAMRLEDARNSRRDVSGDLEIGGVFGASGGVGYSIGRFSDVVREHARSWPQSHSLWDSASMVMSRPVR
jgi:hypothetical protein